MASGLFESLLSRLNAVFNKSPQKITAFQLTSPVDAQLYIADGQLTITAVNAITPFVSVNLVDPYDAIRNITIQNLYTQLQVVRGLKAQDLNVSMGALGTHALIEGSFNLQAGVPFNVEIATSLLWAIFKPLAYVLQNAKNDVDSAVQQLDFLTSSGEFLDYWGTIFGIARYSGEPDYEYSIRLLWETIKPRLNNIAIENLLERGIRYQTDVIDFSQKILVGDGYPDAVHTIPANAFSDPNMVGDGFLNNATMGTPQDTTRYGIGGGTPYTFNSIGVYVQAPLVTPYFSYTTPQVEDIVNRHRPAGSLAWFFITQIASESVALVLNTVESFVAAIEQAISDGVVKMFGHDDYTFYGDHWSSASVAIMPWFQNNLEIPSLGDGLVIGSADSSIAPINVPNTDSYFVDGSFGDGLLGGFGQNVLRGDGSSDSDYFNFLNRRIEYTVAPSVLNYTESPVILSYQRVGDEFLTPRIDEILGADIMTASSPTGTVNAWLGSGSKASVNNSGSITITTPLQLVAPVSITGVRFDAVSLLQTNIHTVPTVYPNLELSNLGDDWLNSYSATRRFVIPVQDAQGNLFFQQIEIPFYSPPPVTALQISNPTAAISATVVQVVSGGAVTINWSVTNSSAATIRQIDQKTQQITDTGVIYNGAITYHPTDSTEYEIIATGNNGQTATASILVSVVPNPLVASAPTITATALPSVCELCETNSSVITYTIVFNSHQTESQSLLFASNAISLALNPIATDPLDTIILTRQPIVSRNSDGLVIAGGWQGLGTTVAVFYPVDPGQCQGQTLTFNYDVNYGQNSLSFNGEPLDVTDAYEITQQATVVLPPPPLNNPGAEYSETYKIIASNFAAFSSLGVPIYVQPVQQGPGTFACSAISPASVPEAIALTINESIPVTISGTGFSSKMEVWLTQPSAIGVNQFVQAHITSLDWENGNLTFIAPDFQFGTYPVRVTKLNCVGETVANDDTLSLVYLRSTYRDPPSISALSPSAVCVGAGFVSQTIVATGVNFRSGVQVSIVLSTGPLAMSTTFINETTLTFVMNYTTLGSYDLLVQNNDTSSGSTNNQPLKLINSTIAPTINDFGFNFTTDGVNTCSFYSAPFTLYWSTTNASYVTFTSSDSTVQAALNSSSGFPPTGSLSVVVKNRPTTITMTARSECGVPTSSSVTINTPYCYRTLDILIQPKPILINQRVPTPFEVFREATTDANPAIVDFDISKDSALTTTLVSDTNTVGAVGNYVSLTGNVLMPLLNGIVDLRASWNGFNDTTQVIVQMPVPVSLSVTPSSITFGAINQAFQLAVIATYSDGSTQTVTNKTAYRNYDPNVLSVTSSGLITTLELNNTSITCSFADVTVDPSVVVATSISVTYKPLDPCLTVERLYVSALIPGATSGIQTPYSFGPANFAVNAIVDNIRSASVNGASVLNTALQSVWSYSNTQLLTASKAFNFVFSNYRSGVKPVLYATVLETPVPVIANFQIYDAAIANSAFSSTSIELPYSHPLGMIWNTTGSCAVTVAYQNPVLRVNAGGNAIGDFIGDNFSSDGYSYSNPVSIDLSNVANPAPTAAYQVERYGYILSTQQRVPINYTFQNLQANTGYNVRLHFAEIVPTRGPWPQSNARLFSVVINNETVLNNFDVCGTAGGLYIGIVEEFTTVATSLGEITVTLNPGPATFNGIHVYDQSPIISAIEIVETHVAQLSDSGSHLLNLKLNSSLVLSATTAGKTVTATRLATIDSLDIEGQYSADVIRSSVNPVAPGQNSALTSTYAGTPTIVALEDIGFSYDGKRPSSSAQTQASSYVAPIANTVYTFNYQLPTSGGGGSGGGGKHIIPVSATAVVGGGMGFGLATGINFDPGPKIVSFTALPSNVAVGQPVTISYTVNNAIKINANFLNGQILPLGQYTTTIYPDITGDLTITATSETGMTASATAHVDVTPQPLSAPCP